MNLIIKEGDFVADKHNWSFWSSIAEPNGITKDLFTRRIRVHKMSQERAATLPKQLHKKRGSFAEYAFYKGDNLIASGTVAEIAAQQKVTEMAIWAYTTPSRITGRSTSKYRLVPIDVDYDEFDY